MKYVHRCIHSLVQSFERVPTYLFLSYVMIGGLCAHPAHSQVEEQDSLALVALYNATDGPNWTNNMNWLTGRVSTWYGISVIGTRVTGLSLFENGLSGSIPLDIFNLSSLEFLSLDYNQLTGSIPPEISNLTELTALSLAGNQLSDSIPPEIGNLSKLSVVLDLSVNQLSGSIPPEIGNLSNLTSLRLSDNQLSGLIPAELSNMTNLNRLVLDLNQLSGPIPPELSTMTNLRALALGDNEITGSFPLALTSMTNLGTLHLYNNQLSGPIPPEIGNMIGLGGLALSGNRLSGSIPPEIGNLINLASLSLDDNQLSGSIPPEIGNLTNMEFLNINTNPLSGALPLSLVNLSNLFIFNFSNTDLCEPPDENFQTWLEGIPGLVRTGVTCNQAPSAPEITSPGDATVIVGGGSGEDPLPPETVLEFSWTEASDPEGDPVTYTWQLSTTAEVSESSVILSVNTDTATHYELDFGTLGSLLSQNGVALDESLTLFHRAVASDNMDNSTAGPAVEVTFIRGRLVSAEDAVELPNTYQLSQNYPNPFNAQTTIRVDLPEAGHIRLIVYDVTGREVARLIDKEMDAGTYAVTWDASGFPSGTYLYRLSAVSFTGTKAMILLK